MDNWRAIGELAGDLMRGLAVIDPDDLDGWEAASDRPVAPIGARQWENGRGDGLPRQVQQGGNVLHFRPKGDTAFSASLPTIGRDMATARPNELPRSAVVISLAMWKLGHQSRPALKPGWYSEFSTGS